MLLTLFLAIVQQQDDAVFRAPSYFTPVFLLLLLGGAIGWAVAAILGFARARVFGPAMLWFALAAVCLIIFHLQFLVIGFGFAQKDNSLVLGVGAFFNLFVLLGSICAIVGFLRLTNPRS